MSSRIRGVQAPTRCAAWFGLALLVPPLLVALSLGARLVAKEVTVPMVDDWLLMPWGTSLTDGVEWEQYLFTVNGHQYVFVKLLLRFLGEFADLRLAFAAIVAVLLAAASAVLLVTSIPGGRQLVFLPFSVGLTLLLFDLRQMQNYFLPICLTWMLGLFATALFVAFHRAGTAQGGGWLAMLAVVVLSPLAGSIGLVVPVYAVVAYLLDIQRQRLRTVAVVVAAAVGVSLAVWLPHLIGDPAFGSHVSLDLLVQAPLDAMNMALIAIGQPFVPWDYGLTWQASILGAAAAIVFAFLALRAVREQRVARFVCENPLIVSGWLFAILLVLTRAELLGPLGSFEPRYTTGAVLLWLGLLLAAWRSEAIPRPLVATAALTLGIVGNMIAGPSGLAYHEFRWAQSVAVVSCFEQEGWVLTRDCVDLAYPGDWMPRAEFDATIKALHAERKALFLDRP